jgi:hypothetical protein
MAMMGKDIGLQSEIKLVYGNMKVGYGRRRPSLMAISSQAFGRRIAEVADVYLKALAANAASSAGLPVGAQTCWFHCFFKSVA